MSYKSIHMQHPVGRGMIRAGMEYIKIEDLFKMSKARLRKPDPQHYGNTKWGDHVILYFYIMNNFVVNAGAKDLGTGWNNFYKRLCKINAMDWMQMNDAFKLYYPRKLTKKKLIGKRKVVRRKGTPVTTLMVARALKENNGNVESAAKQLGCSKSIIYSKRLGIKD